jgi:hypothetical protein
MDEIALKDRVTMTKDKSIDPDYGYLVEVDGEDRGAIVGIDCECGLVFEACMPLREFELLAIGAKLEEKQAELFREGLLG